MKPPLTDLLRGCRLDVAGTVPRADPGDVGAKETAPQQPERRLAPARFANSVGEYDSNRTPTGPATLCSDDTAVDFSNDHGYGSQTAAKTLTAGLHLIVMEFYENGGAARATSSWT